jgi:hypothetical protein
MKRKWLAVGIILLFVGTINIPATALVSPLSGTLFSPKTKTMVPGIASSQGEVELKYYKEDCLDIILGVERDTWKTAIRLTQDEMATYSDWTLTKVNVAFSADNGCSVADIRIFIYGKGDNTHPGNLITCDTVYSMNTTGITTVPLVTSIDLSGYEELWVAVEWIPIITEGGGIYYVWMDTLSGPHVPDKSDFYYLNGNWFEVHDDAPWFDGRWGIGAIVEGPGTTGVTIGDIKGPLGITTDLTNIGVRDAINVSWSISVTGGLLHKIHVLGSELLSEIDAGCSAEITVKTFFGFGIIQIKVSAEAENAPTIQITKTALLLGPFVVGIR